MKIILFIDCLGPGGAQRQLVGLAVMLKQRGYQVKVCYYQDIPFYVNLLDENGVPHQLIQGSDNHIKRIPILLRYFKKENPDWVIAFQETPSLVSCIIKILGGRFKLLVSERNTTQVLGKRERIRFFLYRFADAIIPNSYTQGHFLVENYPWMETKVKTIVNFVDLKLFNSGHSYKSEVPEVVIAATISSRKNTKNFILAVELLKNQGIKCHIAWYGLVDDRYEENIGYQMQCLEMIQEKKLSDIMELREKTQNISEVYRKADFLCLPSLYEGTPNTICEAMASGLPVICSNVCDNPQYVHESENGFLFDPLDVEDMANKIKEAVCMQDKDYRSYCVNSRKLAENYFSEESFITKYLNIISESYQK